MSGSSLTQFGERKVKTPNNDFYPSARFSKHIEPLPGRNRETSVENKLRSGIESKPKTRERLAPLDKGLLREPDPFSVPSAKNIETPDDPLRDNFAFKKRASGRDLKIPSMRSPVAGGGDTSNPYNATWTRMVLKNHFDVSMETADDNQGFKWKIRRIKNVHKKTPEKHRHDERAESPKFVFTKGYSVSGGNKRTGNKKIYSSMSQRAFTNVEDLPLGTGTDFISAKSYLKSAALNIFEQNDGGKFDTNWLADTFATSKH